MAQKARSTDSSQKNNILDYPDKVTLSWLWHRVPARLGFSFVGLVGAAFLLGIQSTRLHVIREVFRVPPASSERQDTSQALRDLLQYAVVTKDGQIVHKERIDEFGLFVERRTEKAGDLEIPYYLISFEKDPGYFEITTQRNATVNIKRITARQHRVEFAISGFGEGIIECDFRITIY